MDVDISVDIGVDMTHTLGWSGLWFLLVIFIQKDHLDLDPTFTSPCPQPGPVCLALSFLLSS